MKLFLLLGARLKKILLCLALACNLTQGQGLTVSTLAGSSILGEGDSGPLRSPSGIAADSNGNVYVSDTLNHVIRRISATREVTVFAGEPGLPGTADGPGRSARLNLPVGITVGQDNSIYFADTGSNSIRKISGQGIVSTLAVSKFGQPTGLAFDDKGVLYFTDKITNTINKLSTEGSTIFVAGSPNAGASDGAGSGAQFNRPTGISFDKRGFFYVADGGSLIRKVTTTGVVTTINGLRTRDGSLAPGFRSLQDVFASADGSLYVAGGGEGVVWHISTDGIVDVVVGTPGRIDLRPQSVCLDLSGNIYTADFVNNKVYVSTLGSPLTTIAGTESFGSSDGVAVSARFSSPSGVAVDRSGNIYVADSGNAIVRKISSLGIVTTLAGVARQSGEVDGVATAARFSQPEGIALSLDGTIYIADAGGHTVRRITADGTTTTIAGSPNNPGFANGIGAGARFNFPRALAIDRFDNLYVADWGNDAVRKIDSNGVVTTLAGGSSGHVDGVGANAKFYHPTGIAVDSVGNIYVADSWFNSIGSPGSNTIRKITSAGAVSTISGKSGISGSIDGLVQDAVFASPSGIAVDSKGNLFISDTESCNLRMITPAGLVTTIAGGFSSGGEDGTGVAASFNHPQGLAVDIYDNLIIADTENNSIRLGRFIDRAGLAARIINVSVRGYVGTGDNVLIAGFISSSSAKKNILVRAVGPTLAQFGVTGTLAQDTLTFYNANGSILYSNSGWGGAGYLKAAFNQNGAFMFPDGSKDSALVSKINAGAYTVVVNSIGTDGGVALEELYDIDNDTQGRLINISARGFVGNGEKVLIAGFTVVGQGTERVLIRAVGPSLSKFGVSAFLPEPKITVRSTAQILSAVSAWNGNTDVVEATGKSGAFSMPVDSKDAAIVMDLVAGAYTVVVEGTNGTTGIALVEVYEIR